MPESDSIDWTDETIRTLDELARIAFPDGAGVTGKTLGRLARAGKLTVYRPGKAHLSTLANVREALDATRPKQPSRPALPAVPNALGLTEAQLARLALDRALEKSREQAREDEWERAYRDRKTAAAPKNARSRRPRRAACQRTSSSE